MSHLHFFSLRIHTICMSHLHFFRLRIHTICMSHFHFFRLWIVTIRMSHLHFFRLWILVICKSLFNFFCLMVTLVLYSNCRLYFICIQKIVLCHNFPPFLSFFFHTPVLQFLFLFLSLVYNHFAFVTMPCFYLQCSTALCTLFAYLFLAFRNIQLIYQNSPVMQLLK